MKVIKSYLTLARLLVMILILCAPCPNFTYADEKQEAGELLWVYIFDVGQADCILIKSGEHTVLIDAGNIGQDNLILEYLESCGVNTLDMLVATHPHADHIGSLAAVIKNMDNIGTLLMPDVIHTTTTFERLLDAIEEKDVEVTIPQSGDVYELGSLIIQVLAPNSNEYPSLNDYSIVLRVVYGDTVFLFTGDAERLSETEQLEKGYELSADVLKVGHHGSRTSSTRHYLDAVQPLYAVISSGKDNSYGHPHKETVDNLILRNVTVLRTDEDGTIIFSSDGVNVTVGCMDLLAEPPLTTYIGNLNSKIFHLPACSSLPADKNKVFFNVRNDAINSQYKPCKKW